ncbi:MAG: hypothetical protein CMJ78_18395 [Planctomycetaceae bacterium]|nr:hypothetical protein [Planctomycetaceae bacterium]
MRFTPWLDRLKKSPKQRRHRKRSRSRAAESLEQRTLLTALVVTTETDALAAVDEAVENSEGDGQQIDNGGLTPSDEAGGDSQGDTTDGGDNGDVSATTI